MSPDHTWSHDRSALLWPLALVATAFAGTLVTACIFPFAAVATLAAATQPRPRALLTVGVVWAINQAVGFGCMHYPLDASTIGWGVAIGVAALAAGAVASLLVDRARVTGLRLVLAFTAAFASYELLLFAYAQFAGGVQTFAPSIVLMLLRNDSLWLLALGAVYVALTSGAPRWFGSRPALRLA